jgi:hypothetical protein
MIQKTVYRLCTLEEPPFIIGNQAQLLALLLVCVYMAPVVKYGWIDGRLE